MRDVLVKVSATVPLHFINVKLITPSGSYDIRERLIKRGFLSTKGYLIDPGSMGNRVGVSSESLITAIERVSVRQQRGVAC